jgi:hypothetical protein
VAVGVHLGDAMRVELSRVVLVILNGALAIVALWGLMLAVTGRDRLGVTLVLALLSVPVLNGAVILASRLLARARR